MKPLYGTENAIRILKELVSVWDKIRLPLLAIRSIRGTGAARVTSGPDGIVIHVPPAKGAPEEKGGSLIGSWCKLVDYDDTFGNQRHVYSADLYRSLDGADTTYEGIGVVNAWETENTSSLRAGYTIVTSGAVCGDIIQIDPLPMGQWYQIVDVVVISGTRYPVISQRNDPVFQES